MKMTDYRHLLRLSAALLACTAMFVACDDDDDDTTTTKNSLSGTVYVEVPSYARINEEISGRVYGAENPDGEGVGYTIYIPGIISTTDTLVQQGEEKRAEFTITMPEDLKTYTVTGAAFAEGYDQSQDAKYLTAVDPGIGKSLTGTGIEMDDPKIFDSRTSAVLKEKKYYYTAIGGKDWFRNNLAYKDAGISYEDSEAIDFIFGRYYNYEEAKNSCPNGWKLPSAKDWANMCSAISTSGESLPEYGTYEGLSGDLMANASFNGDLMWEFWPAVKITNKAGFAAIPTGYAVKGNDIPGNQFYGLNEYSVFWTSSENPDDPTSAYIRYFNVNEPNIYGKWADKETFCASVRCVRK